MRLCHFIYGKMLIFIQHFVILQQLSIGLRHKRTDCVSPPEAGTHNKKQLSFPRQNNTLPTKQFHKPPFINGIDRKFPAVEVFESARVGRESERQLIRAKRLRFRSVTLVERVVAVFSVAEQRVTDMREMGAYLMSSSRQQIDLNE